MLLLGVAAAGYAQIGWRIVPVVGEQPRLKWKEPPSRERIEPLWDDPQTTGLAVILGPPSGNLIARDFDNIDSYLRWRAQNPELADLLPTARTPRPGRHVFARTAGAIKTQRFDDGELRGAGAIVVLPPSLHSSGQCYSWMREPGREIPIIEPRLLIGGAQPIKPSRPASHKKRTEMDPTEAGKESTPAKVASIQATQATQASTQPTQAPIQHIACVNSDNRPFIDWAIQQTVPTQYGLRNRRIFLFARHLRTVFDATADLEVLRPYVQEWHQAAFANIRTKDFSITWQDFVLAWKKVRLPSGAILEAVKSAARKDQFTLGLGDIHLDMVARVFRAAALTHGTEFYMDYRTIGRCVGLSPVAARDITCKLVGLDLLVIVENGSIGTKGRATVWRWFGPLS
jgi:Bifunctional DNA primase/polymerase, N-terminal